MDQKDFFARQIRSGEDLLNANSNGMTIVQNLTKTRLVVGHQGWAIDPKGRTAFSIITEELLQMQEDGLISIDLVEVSPVTGFISGPVEEAEAVSPVAEESGESSNNVKKTGKKQKQQAAEIPAEQEPTIDVLVSDEDNTKTETHSDGETSATSSNNDDNVDTTSEPF